MTKLLTPRTPLEEAEYEVPAHTFELMRRLAAERKAGVGEVRS